MATHNETANFLREQIQWAKGILAAPNVCYPNGRMSHEVARARLDKYRQALEDYAMQFGQVDVMGQVVGYGPRVSG